MTAGARPAAQRGENDDHDVDDGPDLAELGGLGFTARELKGLVDAGLTASELKDLAGFPSGLRKRVLERVALLAARNR